MAGSILSGLDGNQCIRNSHDETNQALRVEVVAPATLTTGFAPSVNYIGQKTVATTGTAVQLVNTSTPITSVVIKALAGNTGKIYVWNAAGNGTTNGYELSAGNSVGLAINDLSKVWIDASVNSQVACYIAS